MQGCPLSPPLFGLWVEHLEHASMQVSQSEEQTIKGRDLVMLVPQDNRRP